MYETTITATIMLKVRTDAKPDEHTLDNILGMNVFTEKLGPKVQAEFELSDLPQENLAPKILYGIPEKIGIAYTEEIE